MEHLVRGLQRLVPEALEVAKYRYYLLREISHHQPIGRRQLSLNLEITERSARSELDWLKARGAVTTTGAGLLLTAEGEELLRESDRLVPFLENLQGLAERLKVRYQLHEVVVVPGDSFNDEYTKKDLGRAGAAALKRHLFDGCSVAVTGGTTLRELAHAVMGGQLPRVKMVLPARGGVGQEMEDQANAIAAQLARSLATTYRLLHVPDQLEAEAMHKLLEDRNIAELLAQIKSCDLVVFGIGSALEMATRRGISLEGIKILEEREAVGEAFRHFFNAQGEMVYSLPGPGLDISDVNQMTTRLAVAGGSNKASAIGAVLKGLSGGVLVTDEGAARAILAEFKNGDNA
ncbi:MAG: sugar-binding transcriptional regulator [Methylocystaceae bacterium]